MAPTAEGMEEKTQRNIILFNASKRELFTPSSGYKTLNRKLRSTWKINTNKEEVTDERLAGSRIFVVAGSRDKFSAAEFDSMKRYLDTGGSILMLAGEGGESRFDTNINFFLEEFGINVNADAVVRTSYYKYFHPKECLISNGVLNRAISQAAGKSGSTVFISIWSDNFRHEASSSCPVNWQCISSGKLAVLGSAHMFHDQYIDKEENSKILDVLIRFLTTDEIKLNVIDADDPEISDYNMLPDVAKISDNLKTCLQESDDIPRDITTLFDNSLFKLDTSLFETPLPPLNPAVFPPQFRELPAPCLDLFDLDEQFSSEKVRLAQQTNKCMDDDLEYYVRECGDILGVTTHLAQDNRDAKHILEYIFSQVVEFKKLNQERDYDTVQYGGGSGAEAMY
ncbi:IFT52-like protein [Mya arenaria]|uniref:IFT52-like protein n=1 Tax=Mya arenaria TaxID=6604 RepID=A0ABY7FT63_MYAAR|nr:IFT52-like protein [Mya arenaria]